MAANKNRLASLVDGLTSGKPEQETATPQEAEGLELTQEQAEKLNALRLSKRGRPKGSKSGEAKEREARATFVVDKKITRQLKYIALMETKLYKTIVSEALTEYIEKWERRNGTINLN